MIKTWMQFWMGVDSRGWVGKANDSANLNSFSHFILMLILGFVGLMHVFIICTFEKNVLADCTSNESLEPLVYGVQLNWKNKKWK